MIVIPAIDLKGGKVVRLLQGDFEAEKVYTEDVESVARDFEAQGAQRLHLVDLDGALKGEPANERSVEKILRSVKIPAQIGGGIRDLKTAKRYFDLGARWVILGTKACLDRGFLREAVQEYGERIIVGIDARDGQVATDGWTKLLPLKAEAFAKEASALGAQTVIYTDISKDGALKGPNLAEIERLSGILPLNWIASGGVSSLADLNALVHLKRKNILGAIVGKALYEKRFSLKEAVKACS